MYTYKHIFVYIYVRLIRTVSILLILNLYSAGETSNI